MGTHRRFFEPVAQFLTGNETGMIFRVSHIDVGSWRVRLIAKPEADRWELHHPGEVIYLPEY
jgi:hypothetical protein